ncbi:translation initiation factor 2 [Lysinibacillus sp. 2017]|uniref:translation initiation factor 2 n=1 Tax=unclassified Lysinibacillus TaxID=2636778 RepID=UPI000D52A66A|nr:MULTISPECIES: translation initiation factor 2 [unclassified Lysinibacillus]AWE08179.1 translation initiation factor 2 [Lysinibacillus sp. 2017]TGN36317.1 translation initiation factor 2 [Lysinibacillus sp. S2017]
MPIFRTIKNNSVIQAVFFGSLTGLVGVFAFILLLQLPTQEQQEELVPTSQIPVEQEKVSQAFYALQFGVFSNFDSAAQFLSSYPALNKSAIFEVDGSYYVWSQLDLEKVAGANVTTPNSFYKQMTLTSSCPKHAELQLPSLLKDEKWFTGQALAVNEDTKNVVPDNWNQQILEIQKLSTNVGVIRLHLLMNYYEHLDCLKVTF